MFNHTIKPDFQRIALFLLLIAYYSSTHAGGFRLPEYSAQGTATSDAQVANPTDIGASLYNPAVLVLHDKNIASINITNINYGVSYTSTSGNTSDSDATSNFLTPALIVSHKISDDLAVAVIFNSPFGLETRWPKNTFPAFGGINALEPRLSKIKMVNTNLNLSYRLMPNTGIVFGIDRYDLRNLQLNSYATEISGKGHGTGWNAGFITKGSNTSFGLHYRSQVAARVYGTIGVAPAVVDVTFPEMLQAGVRFHISNNFDVETDLEYTAWSRFDNLNIHNNQGTTYTKSTNNWNDTLTYRVGGQYRFDNTHGLMFGYAYDETPQGDDYYNARIPDANRQLFSLGYKYQQKGYSIDLSYMYVKFDERTINSSKTFTPGSDANGTAAYNGTYQANAQLVSISFNTYF